jgi:hypothetical protein
MQQIRILVPTIIATVKAIEQGCRNIQLDAQFRPKMSHWLAVHGELCFGCLATSTFLHLTNKKGRDIIEALSKDGVIDDQLCDQSRAAVYGIEEIPEDDTTDFSLLESAIDDMRKTNLIPLLRFFKLLGHPNANEATNWLAKFAPEDINYDATKDDVLEYANFLRDEFLPLLKEWFPEHE